MKCLCQIFKKLVIKIFKMRVKQVMLFSFFSCVLILFFYSIQFNVVSESTFSGNPIILWWTQGFPANYETITCPFNMKCDIVHNRNVSHVPSVDAYLFYGSNIDFNDLPLPRKKTDLWGIFHEESPRNVEELMHEKVLSLFNFSSTFSRHSNVPFPLQYLDSFDDITDSTYFVTTKDKNNYLKDIAPVMFLQSDCETSTERDEYVKVLMKYISVDSYGICLKNKELPKNFVDDYLNNLSDDGFLKFISRYKFVIAIENGVCEDYVTEKFWRAIKVGTVPIYFGSPSIADFLPNKKSAILLDDFTTPEVLAKQLKKLLNNDSLYEQYLEHKTKGLVTNKRIINEMEERPYQKDVEQTVMAFQCYVCGKLHDKKKGNLGINVVTKSHYDCPEPVSALTLTVNPSNSWVYSWRSARRKAEEIFKSVLISSAKSSYYVEFDLFLTKFFISLKVRM